MRLILASTSPRRQELLRLLELPFAIMAPAFVENLSGAHSAEPQVAAFAAGKAQSCAALEADAFVLGSDTLISLDRVVLGKPIDLADAESMLRRLAGRTHRILTAVALAGNGGAWCNVETATVQVTMRPIDEALLAEYLQTRDGLGKAGAYSIQGGGARFIARIEGDFTAAVGLPLRLTADMLRRRGMLCPVDLDALYARKPYPNWARFNG